MFDRSIRRADARFVLPRHPSSALLLAPDALWSAALSLAGIDEVAAGGSPPEVVVAPGHRGTEAAAIGAPMVLLEGPASARRLRSAGYEVEQLLVLPDAGHADLILPLRHRNAVRYALRRRTAAAPTSRRLAAEVAGVIAAHLPGRLRPAALLTIASRIGSTPLALVEARSLGVPDDVGWYLHLGPSTDLAERRMAFLAFPSGSAAPVWAVKVSRLVDMEESFERDERGMRMLSTAAPGLVSKAPRLVGRGSVAGHPMSAETAMVGDRVTEVLRRGGLKEAALVRSVSDWLIELAKATQLPPHQLAAERTRFETDVAPVWQPKVDVAALLDALVDVPAVLVHSDLGTWNVLSDGATFGIVDWESARPAGLPLWDLLYFLADACAQMARQARSGHRAEYLRSLFMGDAELSGLLFELVRAGADASSLPPRSVGVIATLGWLHRGAAFLPRGADARTEPEMLRFARMWMDEPLLGPGWSMWQ